MVDLSPADLERRAAWNETHRALCAERSPLIEKSFLGSLSPAEKKLLRHLERELNWIEMKIMEPDFERMAREVRRRQKLAKEINAFAREIRKITGRFPEGHRTVKP